MIYFNTYFIVMNVLCFIFMGMDKYKAIRHHYRIPEKVLLSLSFFGGSLGSLLGMFVFHHKTKKRVFLILNPLFLLFHLYLILK